MKIPAAVQAPGRLLRISLRMLDIGEPRRLGVSADVRNLGVFVGSMRLDYADSDGIPSEPSLPKN